MASNFRGFTLIEVMVTVGILGVLATIALPLAELQVKRTKEAALLRALNQIRDAIDAYKAASDGGHIERKADESGYPPSLSMLVDGVRDAQSPNGAKLYFLRRVPGDPFALVPSVKPEASWGLRSYRSGPADPAPGPDVFDVYSLSTVKGINGIPYREW